MTQENQFKWKDMQSVPVGVHVIVKGDDDTCSAVLSPSHGWVMPDDSYDNPRRLWFIPTGWMYLPPHDLGYENEC